MTEYNDQPIVELEDVWLRFNQLEVLRNVSLKIFRGEFIILHGETGCGKSSILKLIAGLLSPTSGTIRVAGENINDYSFRQRLFLRRAIGLMMQNSPLLEDRSILENCMLPALAAEKSFSVARQSAISALEKCHIGEFVHAMPKDLSAGQRQQVCLARAVVNFPSLILADEPAIHLDPNNAQMLVNTLGELSNAGITVVMSTHLLITPANFSYREIKFAPSARETP